MLCGDFIIIHILFKRFFVRILAHIFLYVRINLLHKSLHFLNINKRLLVRISAFVNCVLKLVAVLLLYLLKPLVHIVLFLFGKSDTALFSLADYGINRYKHIHRIALSIFRSCKTRFFVLHAPVKVLQFLDLAVAFEIIRIVDSRGVERKLKNLLADFLTVHRKRSCVIFSEHKRFAHTYKRVFILNCRALFGSIAAFS